jgi:rubrerythrin
MNDPRFATISDIIAFAVRREIEAAEGYSRIAAAAPAPALRELAEDLRRQEEEHRRLLEGLDPDAVGRLAPGPTADLRLVDALGDERLGSDMSLQDMLVFAAKKEAQAVALYESLAGLAAGTDQRALFLALAGQEREHKLRLETAYEEQFLAEN